MSGKITSAELHSSVMNIINSNSNQIGSLSGMNSNTISYTYDSKNNVQTETEKDINNNVVKTITYTYDANSNVTQSVMVMNGKTTTTTYNYNASGNVTSTVNAQS